MNLPSPLRGRRFLGLIRKEKENENG